MNTNSISVIIPTYNSSEYIRQAIESVLNQSCPVSEIIVVDDGSTDNTNEIVRSFADKVKYFVQDNLGPAAARNKGVRIAKYEWIAFLDSDDYWKEQHIEFLLSKSHEDPDAVLIYSGNIWVDRNGKNISDAPLQKEFPSGWILNEMFYGNHIPTHAVLVKRSVILHLGGFNEKMRYAEDYDMWLRIAAKYPILSVPERTVFYRRHDDNATNNPVKRVKGVVDALERTAYLIRSGQADERNKPMQIDINRRLKEYYTDAVVCMFCSCEYGDIRSLGFRAIKHHQITSSLFIRFIFSFLPSSFINIIRAMKRSFDD